MSIDGNFQQSADLEGYLAEVVQNPQFKDRANRLIKLYESVSVYEFKCQLKEILSIDPEGSMSEIAFNLKLAFADNSHKIANFLDNQIRVAEANDIKLQELKHQHFWEVSVWNYVLFAMTGIIVGLGYSNINHWINWDNDKLVQPATTGQPDVDYYFGNDKKFNTMQLNVSSENFKTPTTTPSPSTSSSPSAKPSDKPSEDPKATEDTQKLADALNKKEYYELVVTSPEAKKVNVIATFTASQQNVVTYSIPLAPQTDNKTGNIGIIKLSSDLQKIEFVSEEK
jgi:hypothetical protein